MKKERTAAAVVVVIHGARDAGDCIEGTRGGDDAVKGFVQ
jgi:hypothetical protein